MKEVTITPEQGLQILETLKPNLGRFVEERLYTWGLGQEDILLVDEAGFSYTGIPIFGPELLSDQVHIDIAVREDKYTGPKSGVEHPIKIPLPALVVQEISEEYRIGVWDLIKGRNFFSLPTQTVSFGSIDVLIPEPVSHVRAFAEDTILRYTKDQVGEEKIREWYEKLHMIREVSHKLCKFDVEEVAKEMIERSRERWQGQSWH